MRFHGDIVIVAGIFIYIIIRVILFAMKKTFVWRKEFILFLFVLYALMVISVTFFPLYIGVPHERVSYSFINYIPLVSIVRNISQVGIAYSGDTSFMIKLIVKNVGGNILLLMPLGFLAPFIWKSCKRVKNSLLVGLIVSLTIEILQLGEILLGLGLARAVDIDDVICNMIGAVLGCLIYKMLSIRKKNRNNLMILKSNERSGEL